jgi:outer membrane protein OmpA-like peptidoglycan-associated protein
MKVLLSICILLSHASSGYAQSKDTMEVHFALKDTRLTKEENKKIEQLIFKDVLVHGQKLIVLGYADYLGGTEYNEALSTERAKNVKDFLVTSGFDEHDVALCVGKGKIDRAPVSGSGGYANDRKVLIIIDRTQHPALVTYPAPVPIQEKSLAELEANETVALKDILFEEGTDNLLDESYPELEKLAAFLLGNNSVKIQIEGHICCMKDPGKTDVTAPGSNSPLSELRARKVYLYLISKGVYGGRLKVLGLGNTKPLVSPEVTEADQEANRRVEIMILSK